jgi:uncharacterized membrane protein YdjX (TVP38/TMEM64 family)
MSDETRVKERLEYESVVKTDEEEQALRANVKQTLRRLGPTGPMALAAAVLPVIGGFALLGMLGYVAPWLQELDGLGVVLYAVGFAVLGGFALLPTYANSILGGWTFGFAVGYPAALAGLLGGALIAYTVARRASGERVMSIIHEHPKWQAVYDALLCSGFWRTLLIVSLIRLPPNSPYAITNLVMASAKVPRVPFLLGTLIGMAPRTGFTVWVAAGLAELDFKAAGQTWMFVAGLVITFIVILIIGYLAKHAVERVTAGANGGKL